MKKKKSFRKVGNHSMIVAFILLALPSYANQEIRVGNSKIVRSFTLDEKKHLISGSVTNVETRNVLRWEDGGNEFAVTFTDGYVIRSNDLICKEINSEGTGQIADKLILEFENVNVEDVPVSIRMLVEAVSDKPYLYKQLQIEIPKSSFHQLRIDYIDIEALKIDTSKYPTWTHPNWNGLLWNSYLATTGQPVYIDGCYFGSEFPYSDNFIEDDIYHSRYFCGKTFGELSGDGLLSADGKYITWKNVTGVANSSVISQVRNCFLNYIEDIKLPSKMRINYNSWYDWEQTITSDKICASFEKMNEGFLKAGLRTPDTYAIDDGWNAYGEMDNEKTTPNKSGFWEFNAKFPNGLKEAKKVVDKNGANLGLWISPKGGWLYCTQMADVVEKSGMGMKNEYGYGIITGDSVYIHHMRDFMLDVQREYNLNYWKIDGFFHLLPQDTKTGRYITGGYKGMYHVTEHWERWLKVLKELYEDAKSRGTDLWLNLTSRTKPSPWFLQFCNSVWITHGEDQYDLMIDERDVKLEKQMNYRDNIYYENFYERQYQFPAYAYFNHDPSYGKSRFEPNCATDEEFRIYLYMIAMRGAYLWDMLYSAENLDVGNKWAINTEVLSFAETHQKTLGNSMIFGERPSTGGCIGYSAWDEEAGEGFLAVRNPSGEEKTLMINLTSDIGVPENVKDYRIDKIVDYLPSGKLQFPKTCSFADSYDIKLGPGEAGIYRMSKDVQTVGISTFSKGNNVRDKFKVFDSYIELSGIENDVIYIYSIEGKLLYKETIKNHYCRLPKSFLGHGLFLIKTSTNSIKVAL